MCGCEISGMVALYIFLSWLIGLPLLLMADAYIRGRYDKSIFAVDKQNDEWDRGVSIFSWPIYFACMTLYYTCTFTTYIVKNGMTDAMNYLEKKGKQANDLDYQAEKHLLGKK